MIKHGNQELGPYNLVQVLGSGAYAQVYLARHKFLDTVVAVKVLHASLIMQHLRRFILEARTIAHLEHPNIVHVLNFDIENNVPFLVMEYAPNGSLRQRYLAGTRLSLPRVVTYVKQVALALQYAHDKGVAHLDVKPENILLGKNGEILLGDFGIASRWQSRSPRMIHHAVGTIPYMAPEQINGQPCAASDQYSLAIIAYEWLTGSCPFTGNKLGVARQHLFASPPSLCVRVPTISRAVEYVVIKALSKDPRQRYPSISAFAVALEQASRPFPSWEKARNGVGIATSRHTIRRHLPGVVPAFFTLFFVIFAALQMRTGCQQSSVKLTTISTI